MSRRNKEATERLKDHAKTLYTKENITNKKEIAERVGVTEKTISNWIKDGKWEKFKRNIVLTRQEQLNIMLDELVEINTSIQNKDEGEKFADFKLAQVRRQLVKDIKDLETNALISEHVNSLTDFLNFVRGKDLTAAKEMAHFVDTFIKHKLN